MEESWRELDVLNSIEEGGAGGGGGEGEEFAVTSDSGHTSTASCSESEDCKRGRRTLATRPVSATVSVELAVGSADGAGAAAGKVAEKVRKQGRVVPLADDAGQKNASQSYLCATQQSWSSAALVPRTEFPVVETSFEEPSKVEHKRPPRLDKSTFALGNQQPRESGRGKFSIVSGTVSSVRGKNAVVLEGSNMTVCGQNGKGGGFRGEGGTLSTVDRNCCPENLRKRKSKKKLKNKVVDDHEQDLRPKDALQKKAVEDFLFEMLPEESNLGVDIVREVLGQYEGDVTKALETLLNMVSSSCACDSPNDTKSPKPQPAFESTAEPLQALLSAFSNLDPDKIVKAYQETEGDLELAADALLQADCQEDFASSPSGPSLRAAVTSPQQAEGHSSLRVLLSWLRGTFPAVDADILFEVLQANDFSPSKTVDFLLEGGLAPAEEVKLAAASVTTAVMHTLFKPKEEESSPPKSPVSIITSASTSDSWQLLKQKSPRDKSTRRIEDEEGYGEYQASRKVATQHWQRMNECFTQAAYAYGRGERAYAGILSAQGKDHQKLAREASDNASSHLFSVKNKHLVNNITIDLHAQHVKEAMALLKLHLKSLAPLASVHTLTVITGHGNGHAKIRPAVLRYLEKKGIVWKDENSGCLVIDMRNVDSEKLAS